MQVVKKVKGWRLANWLRAEPWLVWPLSKRGWRYHVIYDTCRNGACHPGTTIPLAGAEPKGRLRSLWLTVCFPHVHDDEED